MLRCRLVRSKLYLKSLDLPTELHEPLSILVIAWSKRPYMPQSFWIHIETGFLVFSRSAHQREAHLSQDLVDLIRFARYLLPRVDMLLTVEEPHWLPYYSNSFQPNLAAGVPIRDLWLLHESYPHMRPLALESCDLLDCAFLSLLRRDRPYFQILKQGDLVLIHTLLVCHMQFHFCPFQFLDHFDFYPADSAAAL